MQTRFEWTNREQTETDLLFERGSRQDRYAGTCLHGTLDRFGTAQFEGLIELCDIDSVVLQVAFDDAARAGTVFTEQERPVKQIGRSDGFRASQGMFGWNQHLQLVSSTFLHQQEAIVDSAFDNTQINAVVGHHADDSIRVRDPQANADVREAALKVTEQFRQHVLGHGGAGAESEQPGAFTGQGLHRRVHVAVLLENAPGVLEDRLTGGRQADAIVDAIEKSRAELLFKLPYLMRDRGLRHVQRFGGTREAEHACHRVKYLQTSVSHGRSASGGSSSLPAMTDGYTEPPHTVQWSSCMRASRYHIATTKETPHDAEIASHRLMLRAGLVKRLGSGLYSWMPLGLRTLRKIEAIVRREMDSAGALELLMPSVQPGELWEESGRWTKYGPELLRLTDRHARDYCIGPTHEEVVTDIARRELRSYRQLPINLYQVQTKFRDEIRPRFGVMRAREFIMKDAYSFDLDAAGMQASFDAMNAAYVRIFDALGLDYRAVEADGGSIGGATSREYHVLAESGEDALVYSTGSDYAANLEKATSLATGQRGEPTTERNLLDTPNVHTIEELAAFANVSRTRCLKTLLVKGADKKTPVVALLLRGDHDLNEIKAAQLAEVADPLEMADSATIRRVAGCDAGSIGPFRLPAGREATVREGAKDGADGGASDGADDGVELRVPVIADRDAALMSDFICGANEDGKHLSGVNWGRDLPEPEVRDLRNVVEGDRDPSGVDGVLKIVRGIEVGHIFQLGDTYSKPLKASVLDENGKPRTLLMGCYGIGITRVAAAAIEQCSDAEGIVWPDAIAPFEAVVSPIHMAKSDAVRDAAETLYRELLEAGVDVLFDDRPLRPGVMFAEMELIGIPHRFVVSDRLLAEGQLEYKRRGDAEASQLPLDGALAAINRAAVPG